MSNFIKTNKKPRSTARGSDRKTKRKVVKKKNTQSWSLLKQNLASVWADPLKFLLEIWRVRLAMSRIEFRSSCYFFPLMAFITTKALDKTKLLNQPFSLPISRARVIAILVDFTLMHMTDMSNENLDLFIGRIYLENFRGSKWKQRSRRIMLRRITTSIW